MLLVDRLCLSHYSAAALNGSVIGGSWFWPFQYGTIAVAAIAEVFVGQYNGSGRSNKLGEPVWQMIWFSALTALVCMPIAMLLQLNLVATDADAQATIYFKWLMLFCPLFPLATALSAFFIGQGVLRIVTYATIAANAVNAGLDWILIFGIDGWIAPQGIMGAAIATGGAQAIQCLLLGYVFLSKRYRDRCGTGNWRYNHTAFRQCLRIGIPSCIAHTVEIVAWIAYFQIMTMAGSDHLTVAAVANTILTMFYFVSAGISKGVETLAANLIGGRRWSHLGDLVRSALKLHCAVCVGLAIGFFLFSNQIIGAFIPKQDDPIAAQAIHSGVARACIWVLLFYVVDGALWVFGSVLMAAGDTRFIMMISGLAAWLFAIVPSYIAILHFGCHAEVGSMFTALYSLITAYFFWKRLSGARWKGYALSGTS
jgi:MATE family multidrug resistance protein